MYRAIIICLIAIGYTEANNLPLYQDRLTRQTTSDFSYPTYSDKLVTTLPPTALSSPPSPSSTSASLSLLSSSPSTDVKVSDKIPKESTAVSNWRGVLYYYSEIAGKYLQQAATVFLLSSSFARIVCEYTSLCTYLGTKFLLSEEGAVH